MHRLVDFCRRSNLCFCLLFVALLSACGGGGNDSQDAGAQATPPTSTRPPPASPPPPSTPSPATPPPAAVPLAPVGLTATSGNAQASLSWTASAGAVSYNVKRSNTAGGPYTIVRTAVTPTNSTDAGLTNGTTYYYVVTAVNSTGESANSNQVSATPESSTSAFFPIGAWVPPAYDFAKWKGRNVNTMVGVTQDFETWNAEANRLGLHMIRKPRPNPADDSKESLLLAWAHDDEPDGIFSQVPYTQIQTRYDNWKRVDATRNVFINFVGDLNQYDLVTGESGDAWYKKYVAGADWISADSYPVNNRQNISKLGVTVDHLKSLAGSKPVFAFIETADIDPTKDGPGPTPDELRAEIWEVIIHGVRGIFYFPEQVGNGIPFLYDNTPADVAAEMTKQNATITQLAGVLQGAINPSSVNATVLAPLEVAWRSDPSGKYFFVLNLSNTTRNSQTITLSGIGAATVATVYGENRSTPISGGKISDNFGPYAVHIYQVN